MAQTPTSQPSAPPKVDKDTFLNLVRASGLIAPEKLEQALATIPATDRSRPVARALVEKGLLTRFQAERVLAGKTDGFVMGQYRILDELGRGGMGRVFKAEHMTMGRTVALKILSSALVKTERARALFHREVKAAARLNHPNIVTAFDANQVGDRCFLVMEYVDGPNLADLVKNSGPLAIAQACDYIRQAALGLQYAHDIGMVHRDIKPANLLVQNISNKGTAGAAIVKILDFGLARMHSSEDGSTDSDSIETNPKSVMGTPDYLSPEQARSLHNVDGRSDIYSLGCTLYVLLTGDVPFPGGTTMEKLVRHSMEDAKPVNAIRPEIKPEVAAIVAKMMARKPEDRYQSAIEVAAALLPFTGQETGAWVAVEPLPSEPVAPVSSKHLPRIEAGHGRDPWSSLDDAEEGEESFTGTLSGANALTTLTNPSTPKYRRASQAPRSPRQRGKSSNSATWMLLAVIGIVAIIGGIVFIAREMMLRAG